MQTPPQQWNMPQPPRQLKGPNVVLIVLGVLGAIFLVCCGGGGLLLWRSGASDVVACSNLMSSGEYKKAIPPCRAVAEKIPRSGIAHNNLGWCLTLDGQLQEGLSEARIAVELAPKRNSFDTLAMALALSGKSEEALQIETDHVMINGDVANDSERVTLGMVYYSAGRKQEALKQWEIARTSTNVQAQKLATQFEAKYH